MTRRQRVILGQKRPKKVAAKVNLVDVVHTISNMKRSGSGFEFHQWSSRCYFYSPVFYFPLVSVSQIAWKPIHKRIFWTRIYVKSTHGHRKSVISIDRLSYIPFRLPNRSHWKWSVYFTICHYIDPPDSLKGLFWIGINSRASHGWWFFWLMIKTQKPLI